jgi:hypothetical protein
MRQEHNRIMRSLNEFLIESARTYDYRIKIAGELPKENYEAFKAALNKFSVESCSKPKKTPIQSDPHGFPGLKNQEINIFDVSLNYPANQEQLQELAKQCGIALPNLVVTNKEYNDSMNKEYEGLETGSRLETANYPDQTKEQKAASDAYADSYKKAAAQFAGEANTKFEIAGDAEKPAEFNTDSGEGTKSPMSNIKRKSIGDILK